MHTVEDHHEALSTAALGLEVATDDGETDLLRLVCGKEHAIIHKHGLSSRNFVSLQHTGPM